MSPLSLLERLFNKVGDFGQHGAIFLPPKSYYTTYSNYKLLITHILTFPKLLRHVPTSPFLSCSKLFSILHLLRSLQIHASFTTCATSTSALTFYFSQHSRWNLTRLLQGTKIDNDRVFTHAVNSRLLHLLDLSLDK